MKDVMIYMEGGGSSRKTRASLRRGMNRFLHELNKKARPNGGSVKPIFCGDRKQTYVDFMTARGQASVDEIIILLVDSEAPVKLPSPVDHLRSRQGDGWDLTGVENDHVHLMVQTMETWIVADRDALKLYYKDGFRENALPKRQNLEEEDKSAVANALDRSTVGTRKGRYHKIKHAGALLAQIDPAEVRRRCRYCKRLFDSVGAIFVEE